MKKVLKILMSGLAFLVGLYPIIYFITNEKIGLLSGKNEAILSNIIWNASFYTHISLGGIALLIGWTQFYKKLRNKNLKLHRSIGKIYVLMVLFSAIAGIYLGFYANTTVAGAGFIGLGIVWFVSTFKAYVTIRQGDALAHQKMMIISYATCFAAVTFRLWLVGLNMVLSGLIAYSITAWLCWVPNVLIAYWINRQMDAKRVTLG